MDERILELLKRNLQEVFGEGDAARRRAAIEEFYTDDCVLNVPPGTFVGRDALDTFAGDLCATHPHFVYTPHGEPQVQHNAGILAWGSGLSQLFHGFWRVFLIVQYGLMSNLVKRCIDGLFRPGEQARSLRQITSISSSLTKSAHESIYVSNNINTRIR